MKHIKFFLIFFLIFNSPIYSNEIDLLQEVPTSYKGRIRPLDAAAKLWLSENYHHLSIKSKHYTDFHVIDSSALSFLWKLQFCGHSNWKDSPLFWVYASDIKNCLNLKSNENCFCHNVLHQAMNVDQKSNMNLTNELITYHFLKKYYDSSNRSGMEKHELKELSPNLIVSLKDNKIVLIKVPNTSPWHQLKEGMVIKDLNDFEGEIYLKKQKPFIDEVGNTIRLMNDFSQLAGPLARDQKNFEQTYASLLAKNTPPNRIEEILSQEFPIDQRLKNAGHLFYVIPGVDGNWFSINSLSLKTFNKKNNALEPITNFTVYPDDQFKKLQDVYSKLIFNNDDQSLKMELATLLVENYKLIEGTPLKKASQKEILYPSINRLKAEQLYYQLPLIETTIVFYAMAIVALMIGLGQKRRKFTNAGFVLCLIAFCLNTLTLAIRCYVLGRPPVSNMFETVVYVPWMAVFASLVLNFRMKNSLIILGSSFVALGLLIVLQVTGLGDGMENVQAVLESQYWLIVHVLMIVGSYGVFALAGILGQFYLIQYLRYKHETFAMQELGSAILQSMLIGVVLLIPGTILGGVWAAQSWGRFWDWDPKESWAFISSCLYVIFIHMYYFKYIRFFGLAVGAIFGLLAISFTWYGVNYILGTGLHSYGFGSGGDVYYYSFLLLELLFIAVASLVRLKTLNNKTFE